jgi:glycyl-tRNA synthetase beta chain
VVKARLEDADFFFLEDSKTKLSEFVPKLAEVTFQEQLGSLLEKTVRIENITGYILSKLEVSANDQETALRAARLCKADLVTQMLGEKEFTKLQGYMGMIYARVAGETENVATAIYEHYLPRGERDNLPASLAGAIVAIADKMDTVCGIIGVDMIPTGSKDPFALRRAANGIVQILDAFNLSVDLSELIDFTFGTLSEKLPEKNHNLGFVKDFFHQRIEWLLRRKEIDYDIIESVLQSDFSIIPDVVKKAMSLQKFKERDDFIKLVLGFKRVSNIIADQKKPGEVREEILAENAEKVLFAELQKLKLRTRELLTDKKFVQILEELVRFGMFIDKFFDDVLVNVEEDEIRLNRINLLIEIRQLFLQIADISKIVVDLEK